MNKRTVRILLKWSFVANTILLISMILDYFFNYSRLIVPLLVAYAILLVMIIILIIWGFRKSYVIEGDAENPEKKSIDYGKGA